jgi:cell division protein FtsQ
MMELFAKSRHASGGHIETSCARPKKRLIFSALLGVLILSGFFLGWSKLTNTETLPIKSVKIEGDYTRVDHDALQQAIVPFLKGNIFTLNIVGLKDSILQLPWVYAASVARVWPDTVLVHIVQQTAVARWQDKGLLNAAGEVFTPSVDTYPQGLPVLNGPEGQQGEVWPVYQQMAALLAPLGLHIVSLDLSARQAWHLQLENGVSVVLGRSEPLQRLHRLASVYPQVVGEHAAEVLSVDLRYPSGVAVRWKKG